METLLAFLPLIVLVLIMYLLMIRPAQKRQKQMQEMQQSLERGDDIITIGGIHGRIESHDQKHMYVNVDEGSGTVLKFDRVALKEIVKDTDR